MKILILCGSLEPGRDGVGDYSSLLAEALVPLGCQVLLLALHDRFVVDTAKPVSEVSVSGIRRLRLSARCTAKERFGRLSEVIGDFNPQVISLQFVPYAFNRRGMVHQLCRHLPDVNRQLIWQVMFHEVWIGLPRHTPVKHRISGWMQRQLIRVLTRRLKPRVMHTNTVLYQNCLREIGCTSKVLPLFSNIPVVQAPVVSASGKINLVLFGALHAHANVEPFVADLNRFAQAAKWQVAIRHVGRGGQEIHRWMEACGRHALSFEAMGELPAVQVSQVLQAADMGLSTTALPMISKSGAVAAMRAHGLPVICLASAWHSRIDPGAIPEGIFYYQLNPEVFAQATAAIGAGQPNYDTVHVAAVFLEDLKRVV